MKRHMKLIFQILEYIEIEKRNGNSVPLPEFEEYSRSEVEYHVKLCEEAGYIDTLTPSNGSMPSAIIRITWDGHNTLDSMRKQGSC